MATRWWPAPEAGDIVWCRFPQNRSLEPGPKPRPALIIRVFEDHSPRYFVAVAYGTSQKIDRLHSGEFLIARQDAAAYRLAGLSYPTKFNLRDTVELPFNDEWFGIAPGSPYGQMPKLGVLHPSLIRRVEAAWSAAQGN